MTKIAEKARGQLNIRRERLKFLVPLQRLLLNKLDNQKNMSETIRFALYYTYTKGKRDEDIEEEFRKFQRHHDES